MKIDDQISATVAILAKPDGKNFLTDLGDGITNYYKQKDETEKNKMIMDELHQKAVDNKSLADFMQSGNSLNQFNEAGGRFKTAEAAAKANNFWQNNQNYQFSYDEAKAKDNDRQALVDYYTAGTPEDKEKAKNNFSSPATFQTLQEEDQKKQKLNLDAQKNQYEGIKIQHNIENDNFDNNISLFNAETGRINAKTNTKNSELKKYEVQDKLNRTDLANREFEYKKQHKNDQKQLNVKQKEKLREEVVDTIKNYSGDAWTEAWPKLDEDTQNWVIDRYLRTRGTPELKSARGLFGGNYYIPEKAEQDADLYKKQQYYNKLKGN